MDLMIQICLSNFVRVYLVPNDRSIYYMLAKKLIQFQGDGDGVHKNQHGPKKQARDQHQ